MAYALGRAKEENCFHHEGHEEHEGRQSRNRKVCRKERKKDSDGRGGFETRFLNCKSGGIHIK
jgi:hypothetical protein